MVCSSYLSVLISHSLLFWFLVRSLACVLACLFGLSAIGRVNLMRIMLAYPMQIALGWVFGLFWLSIVYMSIKMKQHKCSLASDPSIAIAIVFHTKYIHIERANISFRLIFPSNADSSSYIRSAHIITVILTKQREKLYKL